MKQSIVARGMELSGELKEFAGRRIQFSVGRFAGRIRSLTVRLSDVNGPRGGVDQRCSVRVELEGGRPVIVREERASVHAAIAAALGRAGRAVQRTLKPARPRRLAAGWAG